LTFAAPPAFACAGSTAGASKQMSRTLVSMRPRSKDQPASASAHSWMTCAAVSGAMSCQV
jgi:hypothetical protein